MYEAIVRGKRLGSYEDFGSLVSTLFLHVGKSGMKIVPNKVSPQASWASHYFRGHTYIALPYQVRQFCLDRGVTQGGMREGLISLSDAEIREFFQKSDRYNRAIFGDKLLVDRGAVSAAEVISKPFELIVEGRRIGNGFDTFNEVVTRHDVEMTQVVARRGAHTPFHTSCIRHKVNGNYRFIFGGNMLYFCMARGLKTLGIQGLSSEITEGAIQELFLHYDDHNRRAFRWIVEEKERILAQIP
jgi:hypothetical protein